MFGRTRTSLRLAAVLLLLLMMAEVRVGAERRHLRHRRRHLVEADLSSCPGRCICRPVGEVPCDWCAQTAADDGQDDRVSCEGCGYSTAEREVAGGGDFDRAAMTVACEEAGYSEIPGDLPQSVTTVDLSNNIIERLEPLSRLQHVVNLRLRGNRISRIRDIPSASPDQSSLSVQVLDLSDNQFSSIDVRSFHGFDSLVHLDLSGNSIVDVEDGAFSGLRRLARLDLRDNRLTRLTASTFRGLASLRYLMLTNNRIQTIDRRAFRALEGLVYIVLKGNPIGNQPVRFQFHSTLLTYVDVSECVLSQVPKGLPSSTRYAQLRRNNISSLSRTAFVECPFASIVVLDDNRITDVDQQAFRPLRQLQQLWMSGNRLRTVPSGLPASLQRLLLDFNRIENLTDVFPADFQLNTLSLTGNYITTIASDAFSKLHHLRSIDLSNNQLHQIAVDTFSSQRQLRLLQLSGNPIEQLPADCFRGLAELSVLSLAYVSSDDVRVDDDVFDDVAQSLTRLELDSSPGLLRAVLASDTILVRLSRVGDLSARSSDLVSIRDDLPLFFSASAVRLSSARWHCDRGLIWLRDWLRDAGHTASHATAKVAASDIAEENRCATPRRLAGRTLFSLADDEFDTSTAVPDRSIASPSRLPTTTLSIVESTTPTSDRRSFTSPALHRSVNSRESDGPSSKREQSRVFYGNDTRYQEFDVEQNLPAYSRIDNDDLLIEPSTLQAPTQTVEHPEANHFGPAFGDASMEDPDEVAVTGRTSGTGTSTSVSTLLAVAATIGVTFVIVVVILTVIFRLLRSQKPPPPSSSVDPGSETYCKNAIKQRQRGGTLYFMPALSTANGVCLSAPTSRTRLDMTLSSGADGAKSVGEISSLLPAANGRDVPGRNTSSGDQPLRMYKWEDF